MSRSLSLSISGCACPVVGRLQSGLGDVINRGPSGARSRRLVRWLGPGSVQADAGARVEVRGAERWRLRRWRYLARVPRAPPRPAGSPFLSPPSTCPLYLAAGDAAITRLTQHKPNGAHTAGLQHSFLLKQCADRLLGNWRLISAAPAQLSKS